MQANQFDLFDVVVNVVPMLMLATVLVPFAPRPLAESLTVLDGVEVAGLGILGVILAYGFGELLYGFTKNARSSRALQRVSLAFLQRVGYIASPPADFEGTLDQYHWMQTYAQRALDGKSEPFAQQELIYNLLKKGERRFDIEFVERTEDEFEITADELTSFYYLAEGTIYGERTMFGEFQIQSQLFQTLWFVFMLALAVHLVTWLTSVLGWYEPIWMTTTGGTTELVFVGALATLLAGCAALSLKLYMAARERQVKRFIYDSYVHL